MRRSDEMTQAVILAGGKGTRLGTLTESTPKPMVLVNGRPFLEYVLKLLKRNDITEILILTGYLGDQVEHAFGSGKSLGLSIQYSREPEPLGTGGALLLAEGLLAPEFFLLNGDTYLDMDYAASLRGFRNLRGIGPFGMMVVWDAECAEDIGNVKLDPTGTRIVSYKKGHGGDHLYIDAGILILSKEVLEMIPLNQPSGLEDHVFPKLAEQGRLLAFDSPKRFYDIGIPERLSLFERSLS